eukprot:10750366-Lingulodinium_polyedra.AAC.1
MPSRSPPWPLRTRWPWTASPSGPASSARRSALRSRPPLGSRPGPLGPTSRRSATSGSRSSAASRPGLRPVALGAGGPSSATRR